MQKTEMIKLSLIHNESVKCLIYDVKIIPLWGILSAAIDLKVNLKDQHFSINFTENDSIDRPYQFYDLFAMVYWLVK